MARKPVRKKETSSLGPQIVTVLLVVGVFAFLVTQFFKVEEQLAKLHKEVFQSTDVVTKYSFSPSEFALVITSKIKTKPLPGVFATGLVYKVVHFVGPTHHRGTMELKLSENVVLAETMASDVKTDFNVIDETTIEFTNPEIVYKTLDKEIKLAKTRGKVTFAGRADLVLDELEYNDPKYKVKLTQVTMTASKTEQKLSVKAMGLTLNGIDIKNPTLAIQKADSGNTSFTGMFKEQPIVVSFKTEVQDVAGQKFPIRYGEFSFPVALFDAAFDPVIDAQMKQIDEVVLARGDSKKTLIYNLTKDSTRKMLKLGVLQGFTHPKNIRLTDNFYKINIPKNDKLIQLESELKTMAKAQKVADGWMKIPGNGKLEEAYAHIMMAGNDVNIDATEILLRKLEKTEANNPLYMALKGRYLLGRASNGHDRYDEKVVDAVKDIASTVNELNPGHKITNLLNMKLAHIRGDDVTYQACFERFLSQEKNEQIKLVFKSSGLSHKDNAEALRLLEQANAMNPDHFVMSDYLGDKAHLAGHLGDVATQEAAYKALVNRPDPHIYDLINYSKDLLSQDRFDEARPYIEKCYAISGPQNYCHTFMEKLVVEDAYKKNKAGNTLGAIKDIEDMLVTRPQSMAGHFALGWLYSKIKDDEKSLQNYSLSCAFGAENGCVSAGDMLYHGKNDIEKSLVFFDLACEENSALGCMKAGFRSEQKDQKDNALSYFTKSCRELKDNIGCYHQARLFQKLKRPKEEIAGSLDLACSKIKGVCKLSAMVKSGNNMELPMHPPGE